MYSFRYVWVCGWVSEELAHPWWRHKRWRQWCHQWWPSHPCNSSGSSQCRGLVLCSRAVFCSMASHADLHTHSLQRVSAPELWSSAAGPDVHLAPGPSASDQASPKSVCSVPWGDIITKISHKMIFNVNFKVIYHAHQCWILKCLPVGGCQRVRYYKFICASALLFPFSSFVA